MKSSNFLERHLKYIFPLPALMFVFLLMIFPVAYTLFISFTDWTLTSGRPLRFVGFDTYLGMFREPRFLDALGRTLSFTLVAVFFEALLGTIIALVLNREFRGKGLMKFLLLLPLVSTPVAIGIVFNLFYDPTIGFLNFVLNTLGLPQSGWVTDPATVMGSLILVDVWQWTPMIALVVLAGLSAIPNEPYESATVDGANGYQILRHITMPMILPTIFTAVILRSIDALKTYDIIYAMSRGGPGYSSETWNIMAYKYSFEYFALGQSSTILVFLFMLVLLFSLLVVRVRKVFEL